MQVTELGRIGICLDQFDAYDSSGQLIKAVSPLLHPMAQESFPLLFVYRGAAGSLATNVGGPESDGALLGVEGTEQYVTPLPSLQLEQAAPTLSSTAASLVLIPLCRKGDRAGIERNLLNGANVAEVDVEGNTPLHVAVEAPRNETATVQCLLEHGADPNSVNYLGATPLHYVCLRKTNHRGIANILLENGAIINAATVAGKTALHFACEQTLPELVEVLCMFGSDVNVADAEGNLPANATLAKAGGRDTVKKQILEHILAYGGSIQAVCQQGLTCMHLACRSGYIRSAQLLSEHAADVNALTAQGETALHLACRGSFADCTQWLIAVAPFLVNVQDSHGNTPLHVCATVGNLDGAVLLIRNQADTSIRNSQNKTSFEIAKIRGTDLNNTHNPELVQILKEATKSGSCRQQ